MKKYLRPVTSWSLIFFLAFQFISSSTSAQCNNADFSAGNLSGWWGTYGECTSTIIANACFLEGGNPTQNNGFLQGPLNAASNSATQYSQTLCSTGNDANMAAYGVNIPCVYTGATYSVRLGSTTALAEGETMTYTFMVTAANCNFTYHYAVVLDDAGEAAADKPGFSINVRDSTANAAIPCATYAVTAQATPGFDSVLNVTVDGNPTIGRYTQWSSVFVPLNAYIGHYVSIQFVTHSCYVDPACCGGRHYAYAYICCTCAPLALVASSPAICGGHTVTLTAPAGAASYLWTGPGIVGSNSAQTVTVSDSGKYTVNMMTFGSPGCPFSLDTTITLSPSNPVANFSSVAGCLGSAATFNDLSTPAGNITAWSWNFGDGTAANTSENPSHTYTTAGTYPVTLTITWPPCMADTTFNVVVATPPTSTFTVAPTSVCAGQTATVTYTGNGTAADSLAWNFDGGTVISGSGLGPYQVNWSSAGSKNVSLTVYAGSCASAVTTIPVTVTAFPAITVSDDTSICPGASAQLSVSNGATSYSWAPAGSLSSSTAQNVVATPATTTTYTVTGNTASCTVTNVVTVRIKPTPTSLFTVASAQVCAGQGDVITFTGTATAAAVYTWAFTGDTSFTESGAGPFTLNVSTAGNESVSLEVVDSGCLSTPTTMPVTINGAPPATFTVTSPVCIGGNSTITYTGNPTGVPTYSWSFSGGTVASGSGAGPYSVSWAAAGNEVVGLTVTDNGCTATSTDNITVESPPVSTFTVNPSSICAASQNATITFTGTASAGANYQWNFSGATIISGSGAGPYQVNWPTAGAENVTLSITDGACNSMLSTVPVTVNATPSAAFTTTNPICLGQTSNITYTGTGTGAATYTWTWGGGTIVSGTPGTSGPFVITWATAGTMNITLTVSENGCTSLVADSTVAVYAAPYASFEATSPVCAGQNSTVTFNGAADNAAVYSWSFTGDSTFTESSPGPFALNISTQGTEFIDLSITDNGCNSNDTSISVTINSIPVSDAGGPTVAFCSGDSARIGTFSTAGYTYSWSPVTGLSNPSISNPFADGTNNTTATIVVPYTVTTTLGTCTSTATVIDSVYPSAIASFTPPAGQCFVPVNSFNFAAGGSFIPSAATFNWDFGTNGVPAASTSQNPVVSFSEPGTQTVSLTISQLGCASSTYTATVDVYAVPIIYFNAGPLTGCQPLQVCFTDSTTPNNSNATYIWSFGNGQSSNLQNPCITYTDSGVYSVEEQVITADGCAATPLTRPDLINVSGNPAAAFTPNDATIQLPEDTISLTNQSKNATSYLWDLGVLGSSTATNPILIFTLPGIYPVALTAFSAQGCVDSTSGRVIVLPPVNYFIPNVFTPNGDGRNDQFYVEMQEGVTVYKFEIFDRWGELVHSGLYPWDGTYKGKPCPEGVYIYEIQLRQAGQGQAVMRKGSVTLLR